MFEVTLRTGNRKTISLGFFESKEVAEYVAENAEGGFVVDDNAVAGVVNEVQINTSETIEDYNSGLNAAAELNERAEAAKIFQGLSERERELISRFGNFTAITSAEEPAAS